MEADWTEVGSLKQPAATPSTPSAQCTAFCFDTTEELLWIGSDTGRVVSYHGPQLQRYTSWRAHSTSTPPRSSSEVRVRQILVCNKGVVSVSQESVHLSSRRGLTQWHIALESMTGIFCMAFSTRDATELIVAGFPRMMYRVDVEKGVVTDTCETAGSSPYTLMRFSGQYICAAAYDGSIHLLDPVSLAVCHSFTAYAGKVNDMDTRGDYLLTCGWVQMQHQGLQLERFVRVYNLKTKKPAPPLPFPTGAAYVRLHPKLSSTCIVLGKNGQLQSLDIQNPELPTMKFARSAETEFMGLEVMPSGKGFGLGDGSNDLRLWGSPNKLQYTDLAKPTEFPDPIAGHKQIDWSPNTPISSIGMPYYREPLLSNWPNSLIHTVGQQPSRIENLDSSFRNFEFGKVGPNPRNRLRNQAPDLFEQKLPDPVFEPKFLSEKANTQPNQHRRMSEDLLKAMKEVKVDGKPKDVKFLYRNVEIKYSKFGVEDFDFRYYNKTKFAGLETHIINSYANPLLQLLRFTVTARNISLYHTARDCTTETCLLCELGFLVDMLEKASAPNCQATNFLRALSKQPDAFAQHIIETQVAGAPLTQMVQNLNRFLFQKLEENFRRVAPSLDQFHLAFGTIGLDVTSCAQCKYESRTDKVWYAHDLAYPPPRVNRPRPAQEVRQYFSQVLKASIERQSQHRGWCLRCNGYKNMMSSRAVHNLPSVLMLNTAIATSEARQLWATPDFLPREIGLIVNGGRIFCYEGEDLRLHLQRGQFNIVVYQLVGVIADVLPSDNEKSHLVATIDVGLSDVDKSHEGDWHLFNDFLVHSVSQEDALHFNPQWKLPSVITYQAKAMAHVVDDRWKDVIDTGALFRSPAQPKFKDTYQFRALSAQETLPDKGVHVAIDAEFVRLLREEIDVGPTGNRTVTRPARLGLARVSVLRADGHDRELPFIDDYISTDPPIEDHLTRWSGIHEGDLYPGISRYNLVQSKDAYKKLWILVNLGCTFIGHGLSSDLRIINIHVPEAQLMDTQELFSLGARTQRKLSLKFLAWVVLGEDVQLNNHDSIEDARTALRLWLKYLEFKDAGILEFWKDRIMSQGTANNFKPPEKDANGNASAPGTPRR